MPRTPTKAELRQQVEELKKKLEEAEERARLAESRSENADAAAAIREELETVVEAQEALKAELKRANERAENAGKEVSRLLLNVEQLESELRVESARADSAEEHVADARDEIDQIQWELENLYKDVEIKVARAKNAVQEEMREAHSREIAVRDDMIALLKEKVALLEGRRRPEEEECPNLGGGSDPPAVEAARTLEVHETSPVELHMPSTTRKMTLPPLARFSGDSKDDDAFDRWVRKLLQHAELEHWTDREKLLQLELHLSGRAEQIYELLPAEAQATFSAAVESLRQRLHPVKSEALLSAQLMKRKQKQAESVEEYAQDFESLFEKSYGRRAGMDHASKELLRRDLFVQGLL